MVTAAETYLATEQREALVTVEVQSAFAPLIENDATGVSYGLNTGREYFNQGNLDLRGLMEHLGTQPRGFESSEAKVAIVVGFLARQRELERGEG